MRAGRRTGRDDDGGFGMRAGAVLGAMTTVDLE